MSTSPGPDRREIPALSKDRRAARRLALDILYEAEIREQLPIEILASHRDQALEPGHDDETRLPSSDETIDYADRLIRGVQQNAAAIDQMIELYSERWSLDRMPIIDRNLLRIALLELIEMSDVPVAVVINEAIELAKELSTDESGRFVNGVLGRAATDIRAGGDR